MEIRIEKIQESDFKELVSLFLEFATYQGMPDKMVNSIDRMVEQKDLIHGYIARDEDNNIAGYATYFYAYYTWVGKSLYMDDLYVREKYRGKGVGTILIKKVIATAQEEKCNRVRWQVSSWNHPAIIFYQNLGASLDNVEMNCDIVFEQPKE